MPSLTPAAHAARTLALIASVLCSARLAFADAVCYSAPVAAASFLRAEGQSELLPALTVSCLGGVADASVNLQLLLSPTVSVTSAAIPNGTATEIQASAAGQPTVFGTAASNTITLSGLTVPAAVLTNYTVNNIRFNANSIPVSPNILPAGISAVATVSGSNVTPGTLYWSPVAYIANGLAQPVVAADSGLLNTGKVQLASGSGTTSVVTTCSGINSSPLVPGYANFYVSVAEGIGNAFKTKAEEASGVGVDAPRFGTRFQVMLSNIPSGLGIYMPVTVFQGTLGAQTATAQAQIDANSPVVGSFNVPPAVTAPAQFVPAGSGGLLVQGTSATGTGGLFSVPVSNGSASVVYEILADQPTATDTFLIPVYLYSPGSGVAAQSSALSVAVSFAPANNNLTIPSFSLSTAAPSSLATFQACTTTLLFPFVSNSNGYETGLVITNTSLGASPAAFHSSVQNSAQTGSCNLAFYGTNGSNPATVAAPNTNEGGSTAYLPGELYAFTLSRALAGNPANPASFTGFLLAQCNFQYAHGFAYVIFGGLGTPGSVAMGYLAEVLGRGTNAPEGVSF